MFGVILSLLNGPFGNYIKWALIILSVLGGLYIFLKHEQHVAYEQALVNFNQQQQAITAKENAVYDQEIATLRKENVDLLAKLSNANKKVDNNTKVIVKWIKTQPVSKCKIDPIFNKTLKLMKAK